MKQQFHTAMLTIIMGALLVLSPLSFASEKPSLDGFWASQCAADDSGHFNIEAFYFFSKDEVANYNIRTFSDPLCKKAISTLATIREFKLGDAVPGMTNTWKLDYVFSSVMMIYSNKDTIAAANKQPGYYGFTDWRLYRAKNVSGLKRDKDSSPERSKGEKFYTIVKIDNDKLYMGDYASGKGISDETRLSKIYNVPFIKQ